MNEARVVSRRTWTLAVLLIGATFAIYALIVARVGGDAGITAVADIGELLIAAATTAVTFWAATRFRPGEPLRRVWTLLGVSALFFTLGDAAWTLYEVALGVEVPFPSLADALYALEYPFSALALLLAALGYRKLVKLTPRVAIVTAVVVVTIAVVWLGFVGEIVADAEATVLERALSAFYPLADILLAMAPALLVALVVMKLGGGRLGWPWWVVAVAYAVLAVTDTAFSWLDWIEVYQSGHIIDAGWMLGYGLLGVAASLAVDVNRPAAPPRRST